MVLVDPKTLDFNTQTPPIMNKIPDLIPDSLHRFDEEMKNILFLNKGVSLHEKIQHYNQVLEKYLKFYKDYKSEKQPFPQERGSFSQPQTPQTQTPQTQNTKDVLDTLYDETIESLSAAHRAKGKRILSHIKRIPELTWNQKGEMILNNKLYPNSHLEDLIRGVVNPKTKTTPEGISDFKALLKKTNIPSNLVTFPKISLNNLPKTPRTISKKEKRTPKSLSLRNRQVTSSWSRY